MGLDKDLNLVKVVQCTNIMWIRRYYNFDEFQIQTSVSNWDMNIRYIYRNDRKELMIAYKPQYQNTKSRGRIVLVSGYDIRYILNNALVYPRYKKSMNIAKITYDMYNIYADTFIKNLVKYDNLVEMGTSATMQESNEPLGDKFFYLLQTQELSWRVVYNSQTNDMQIQIWKGLDRTQEQSENSPVIWSQAFRNIFDIEYTKDDSNYKNYAIVVGNGAYEDGNQITVIVDRILPGEERRMLYVDATAETYDPEEDSLEEFKASLAKKGEEELDQYQKVDESTFKVTDNTFVYLKDYDLGDKCDIVIGEIEESYTARITEIKEIYKNGNRELELTFGEKSPTVYQKARLK